MFFLTSLEFNADSKNDFRYCAAKLKFARQSYSNLYILVESGQVEFYPGKLMFW